MAVTIKQLEEHIFSFEEIRVFFRASQNDLVPEYPYKNTFSDDTFLFQLKDRIEKTYPGLNFEIVDGRGMVSHIHGKRLREIRQTYVR